MQEIWKPVKGYEGIYEVSNFGNVKNNVKVLSLRVNRGYQYITLYKDGKTSSKAVHRLVAIAFIPNAKSKPEVNHIDGDKLNNHINNLEWCTPSENAIHAYATGLKKPRKASGELNENAKLTRKEVIEIRNRYVKGCKVNGTTALARDYGISKSQACRIVTNKMWKEVI
jgi:hypothetical protein